MASAMMGGTRGQIERLLAAGGVAGLDDGRLLERFADGGDEAAFAALVARHGPLVLGTCRAVLRDPHDADDAFQATFLVLARKAGTVRVADGGSLGGWLYRVASRVAFRARADRLRRRGREVPTPDPSRAAAAAAGIDRAGPWDDWLPTLHEEIARLPERQRAPIVLCDLQGLTYDQAARQLRWTPPTLRCRLAAARARLRARLTRRGLTATGAVAALAAGRISDAATQAVPESWARAAVRAASGGATPAAIALGRHLLRATLLTRLSWLAAALLAAGASAFVAMEVWPDRDGREPTPTARAPATRPTSAAAPKPEPAQAKAEVESEPGETVDVRGRVVGPDGGPVAGATLRIDLYMFMAENPEGDGPMASSGPDGRFTLRAPRDVIDRYSRGQFRRPYRVVASAPGFGPGQAELGPRSDALGEVTVRLVADDVPIEGRVLDLEGRPVAGAVVSTTDINDPPGRDLSPWLESLKVRNRSPWDALDEIPFRITRTSGPDGRFRLDGVGRERLVMFTIAGPTIAIARGFAMTKDVAPVSVPNPGVIGPRTIVYHGPRFDHVAAPSVPVAGVVRDRDTGRPLAGVRLEGMAFEERNMASYREISSTTDEQGRYRLFGCARADRYRLFVYPAEGQPYPTAMVVEAADGLGPGPATIDVALKRGILVRGRITDRATGGPIVNVRVESHASRDNPHAKEFPGLIENPYGPSDYTDADGRFAVAALPGRGFVVARASSDHYLKGIGFDAIGGVKPGKSIPTPRKYLNPSDYDAVAEIDAEDGADPVTVDLRLEPGRTVAGTVVDPDGKPVPGALPYGLSSLTFWPNRPLVTAAFEIRGLDPRQSRRVDFIHPGRDLAGSLVVGKDEPGPVTVRLRPCGHVAGRIVDEDGQPRARLELMSLHPVGAEIDADRGFLDQPYPTDRDGRFQLALIPGFRYKAEAMTEARRVAGVVFDEVKVAPGETRDLGDVIIAKKPDGD